MTKAICEIILTDKPSAPDTWRRSNQRHRGLLRGERLNRLTKKGNEVTGE